MRHLLILIITALISCESHSFDSDKRQLVAKDEIRKLVHAGRSFDISGFKQDTLPQFPGTNFKHPLRYALDFTYTDSTGNKKNGKGIVLFTPDGKSVVHSEILNGEQAQ